MDIKTKLLKQINCNTDLIMTDDIFIFTELAEQVLREFGSTGFKMINAGVLKKILMFFARQV